MLIVDNLIRYTFIFLLKTKSAPKIYSYISLWLLVIELFTNYRVKIWRSDSAKEFF